MTSCCVQLSFPLEWGQRKEKENRSREDKLQHRELGFPGVVKKSGQESVDKVVSCGQSEDFLPPTR